jgi:Holliday junction resolvase RusA-like endonuclease
MTIKLSVVGNQEDKRGNPIPYHRTTQGSKWNPSHKRYLSWKNHVTRSLPADNEECGRLIQRWATGRARKPIPDSPHGKVTAKIYFGKETHADPDNVIKGILDALFENDKEIDVHTSHSCGNPEPKVEVSIQISEPK